MNRTYPEISTIVTIVKDTFEYQINETYAIHGRKSHNGFFILNTGF